MRTLLIAVFVREGRGGFEDIVSRLMAALETEQALVFEIENI